MRHDENSENKREFRTVYQRTRACSMDTSQRSKWGITKYDSFRANLCLTIVNFVNFDWKGGFRLSDNFRLLIRGLCLIVSMWLEHSGRCCFFYPPHPLSLLLLCVLEGVITKTSVDVPLCNERNQPVDAYNLGNRNIGWDIETRQHENYC